MIKFLIMVESSSLQNQNKFLQDWLELDRAFSSGSGEEEIGLN